MAEGVLKALGIRPADLNLLRDRGVPLDAAMPYDPSYQVPGTPPAMRVGDVAGGALQALPSVGDAYSVLQAIADLEAGQYGDAALNGINALPMIAGIGAIKAPRALKNLRGELIPVPDVYYRGERVGGDPSVSIDDWWNSHLFASSSRKDSEMYAGSAGVVHELRPKPEARILYEGTKDFRSLNKGNKGANMLEWASEVTRRANEAGYDAVWFKRQGDIGTAILNRDAFDLPDGMINISSGKRK